MERNETACAVLGAARVKLLFATEQMEHLPWVCCAVSPTNISHIPSLAMDWSPHPAQSQLGMLPIIQSERLNHSGTCKEHMDST